MKNKFDTIDPSCHCGVRFSNGNRQPTTAESLENHMSVKTPTYNKLSKAARFFKDRDGDGNYCGVIALASVTGLSFGKAARLLRDKGRVTGRGTQLQALAKTLEELGYSVSVNHPIGTPTVRNWAGNNPEGVYMAISKGHVATIKDGEIVDHVNGHKCRIITLLRCEAAA